MARVRTKGNQVVIVHGKRDPKSKNVQETTLFTIYSKAEAQAAIGESAYWFQRTLEDEFPDIRFNWKALNAGIEENMESLPDIYGYKRERVDRHFHEALVNFARELLLADPQLLMSSAQVLQDHRVELEYLREMIDWRLKLADQEPNEWNQDDPFYWKSLLNRKVVPGDVLEYMSMSFNNGEYDKVQTISKLLTECWDNFAEGYLSLGTIAYRRDELEEALAWFKKAMKVGRTLFPKRIRKERYWRDHSTRPYIRALVYLAQTYNCIGDFKAALGYCDKLEDECGQDITAASERVPVHMNSREFHLAVAAARYVHLIYPEENLPLAFAHYEMGSFRKARVHFLAGAIRFPLSARMFCGYSRIPRPGSYMEIDDHDKGVSSLQALKHYLSNRTNKTVRFFRDVLNNPSVSRLLDEVQDVRIKQREKGRSDRTWFERLHEMESFEFAESKASEFWPDDGTTGSKRCHGL